MLVEERSSLSICELECCRMRSRREKTKVVEENVAVAMGQHNKEAQVMSAKVVAASVVNAS